EALGDWKKSLAYLDAIQQVTSEAVVGVAKKYLTFENLSVFEYFPESVTRSFSEADYSKAVLDKAPAAVEQRSVQELPVVAQIPVPDETVVHDLVKPIEKRSILRGPDVYIL